MINSLIEMLKFRLSTPLILLILNIITCSAILIIFYHELDDVRLGRISRLIVYIGFFAVGVLLGMFYVLSGYSEINKRRSSAGIEEKFQDSPRLKNLIYLFSGAATALFVNWEPFVGNGTKNANIFASYMAGTLIGCFGLLWYFCQKISKDLKIIRNSLGDKQYFPREQLILEYLHYGYEAYRDELKEHIVEIEKQLTAQTSNRAENLIVSQTRFAGILANFLILEKKERILSPERIQNLNEIRSALLILARDTINLFCRNDQQPIIEVTQMKFVNSSPGLDKVLFHYGDDGRYHGYLQLIQRFPSSPNTIFLPVPDPTNGNDEPLPGAPTAFVRGNYSIVSPKKLDFPMSVPGNIQEDITKYFSTIRFKNVASILSICYGINSNSDAPIGVLNIESSLENVIGDAVGVEQACAALHPILILLGAITLEGG